jgi:dihydrofolate reductase
MQIYLSDFISLDGVVQAPGGEREDTDGDFRHGGWSMPYFDADAMGPVLAQLMERTEALLFGRRTWEAMAGAWPGRAGDPFADRMNAVPKYLVSGSVGADEAAARWSNTMLIGGDDPLAEIGALRERPGDGVIQVMGSPSLARRLIEADLVDEYRLMIEPILLGGGKTIFPADASARPLELVFSEQTGTGVLICGYRPAG